MQRNCSSAESSSANDARKTPSKHARRRTTEGETTSTTQDDAQHHREHDTIPSHNTIMPAKTQPTTDICGFSRKQDAIIINPDERSSARWARDCAYPAHYVDYETYPEDVGVPEGRLSEEKQLPANIVKLGPHSVEGPKRPCPHCEDGGNFFTKYIGHKKNTAGEVRLAACTVAPHSITRMLFLHLTARARMLSDWAGVRMRARQGPQRHGAYLSLLHLLQGVVRVQRPC